VEKKEKIKKVSMGLLERTLEKFAKDSLKKDCFNKYVKAEFYAKKTSAKT
jgi:hypothetical protein